MGGERSGFEVAEFPHHGKILLAGGDSLTLFDKADGKTYSIDEWIKASTKED